MGPWFIAKQKFGPKSQEAWATYVRWSGLTQLDEVVSIDSTLNPVVLKEMKSHYWPYVPNEHAMFGLFADLGFLLKEIAQIPERNLLCVFLNPSEPPTPPQAPVRFEFLGYDLVEAGGSISALTNCGGFPGAFSNTELSCKGLLSSHARALDVQAKLRALYPEEHHADCDVWAIARSVES
ncbi:MAG: hypothetical protein ACKVQA_02745 [Burkholderiales bacterium]